MNWLSIPASMYSGMNWNSYFVTAFSLESPAPSSFFISIRLYVILGGRNAIFAVIFEGPLKLKTTLGKFRLSLEISHMEGSKTANTIAWSSIRPLHSVQSFSYFAQQQILLNIIFFSSKTVRGGRNSTTSFDFFRFLTSPLRRTQRISRNKRTI